MSSTTAAKRFVLGFHILCTLLALVLISFGIYIICTYDTNDVGSLACIAYICVGAAALVIYTFGCFGAIRENVCCTVTSIILIWALIVGQIVTMFLLTKSVAPISSHLSNTLDAAFEEELTSPGAMSLYENWFQCCGRASPQDYIVHDRLPPATCFKDSDNTKAENLIFKGCRVEFENYWVNLLQIFNILGWILIALEFIDSLISCYLCNSLRNDKRRSYY